MSRPILLLLLLVLSVAILVLASRFGCTAGSKFNGPPPPPETNMIKIRSSPGNNRAIVFIHGLDGNATDTWTNPEFKTYWPEMLTHDDSFEGCDVWVYEYPTGQPHLRATLRAMTSGLRTRIEQHQINSKKMVLVAHSLGGLLATNYLLTHRDDMKQTEMLYLFGSPVFGSDLAKLKDAISDNPVFEELRSDNDVLRDRMQQWRAAIPKPVCFAAYEMRELHGFIVVDEQSASAMANQPTIGMNKNHVSMVKPKSPNDEPYILLKNAVGSLGWRERTNLNVEQIEGELEDFGVLLRKTRDGKWDLTISKSGFGDEDVQRLGLIGSVATVFLVQPQFNGERDVVTSAGVWGLPWENLQFLKLEGPTFDDWAAAAIRERGASLRSLNLANSRITDAGVHELAASGKLRNLWRLQLVNCGGVTDDSVDDLILLLKPHSNGRSPNVDVYPGKPQIDLTETSVSEEARKRLTEALPGVEILPLPNAN